MRIALFCSDRTFAAGAFHCHTSCLQLLLMCFVFVLHCTQRPDVLFVVSKQQLCTAFYLLALLTVMPYRSNFTNFFRSQISKCLGREKNSPNRLSNQKSEDTRSSEVRHPSPSPLLPTPCFPSPPPLLSQQKNNSLCH